MSGQKMDKKNLTGVWPNESGLKMHLYGKHEARPGRKMGHFTVLDKNLDIAFDKAIKVRKLLGIA